MPQLNFNALASGGPQSVYEGFMQGQEIRNKLVQQEQARQLTDIQRQHATLQLQNATREQQAAEEESAAWKAGASDPKVVLQQLQQRGLGKAAMTLQGQLTKQQTDKLAQQKTTVDLVKHSANQVFANPGSALQILQSFGQRTGVDMSDDIAEVQRLGGDLEAVKQWAAGKAFEADKLLPKFQTIDQNDKKTVQGFDPVTGQPVGPGAVYSVGMSPAQVAQNKIAQGQLDVSRGQLKATQDRDAKERAGNVVASTQVDAAGNVTHFNKFGERIGAAQPVGKPSATYEKTAALRKQHSQDLNMMISEFENIVKPGGLIAQSTGSGAGRLYDAAAAFTGNAPEGAIAIAKLQPIADLALKMIPRFEGPQSDKDTASYKEAAGQVANAGLPREVRLAAANTVLRLAKARKGQFASEVMDKEGIAPAASKVITRTGMANGRKVVQYSDGSIEYAN